MTIQGPLLLLGCGKMGGALLSGWLERGLEPGAVTLIDPNAESVARFAAQGVKVLGDARELPADYRPALVLLAVKPQVMEPAMAPLAVLAGPGTLFLSIAAGKTLGWFQAKLGAAARIVRTMPNTPAAVGRGMTVLVAGPGVEPGQRKTAETLMAAVGETAWVEDEGLLDSVTAVSGGGPAYVFLLVEMLAEAGRANGLPAELAGRLARVTVAGAGELLHQAGEPAEQLRKNVTSPGGTTAEALKIMMAADGLQPIVTRAIAAATQRSRELAAG